MAYRDLTGTWRDAQGRPMQRWLVYASGKDRRYLCVAMAATAAAALKAARNNGLRLSRDASAVPESTK